MAKGLFSERRGDGELPALAAEDHVCTQCAVAYADVIVAEAVEALTELPGAVHAAVAGVPPEARKHRLQPGVWSVTEYVCHLRDVYMTYTIRLHRTRTEDRPTLEPMFNDLRARRFRYNERDVGQSSTSSPLQPWDSVTKLPAPVEMTGIALRADFLAKSVRRCGSCAKRCTKVSII